MNQKLLFIAMTILLPFFFLSACTEDNDEKAGQITGLWIQEQITEDGQVMNLPIEQQSLSLLFESNGVYRTYAKEALTEKEHFGAWSITDNTWLEVTADIWRISANPLTLKPENQWAKNHSLIRFSILTLSDNTLEIRIKTFVGERKYSTLFVEPERPLITDENYSEIIGNRGDTTLKTYVYTFKKANY
jgi:hypothetical protein